MLEISVEQKDFWFYSLKLYELGDSVRDRHKEEHSCSDEK